MAPGAGRAGGRRAAVLLAAAGLVVVAAGLGRPGGEGAARAAAGPPVVWVQAGHAAPREPGYRAQTGAGAGPFGAETRFTTRLARAVVARLRRAGVDARATPGRVTPLGSAGAVFLSLHHDSPDGRAAIGHAVSGAGENWYRGEGFGAPSPVPYPDSAPHRPATRVSARVERQSRRLAVRLARRFAAVATPANGARSGFAGVVPRDGNPRMTRYYGYYRTAARARAILEAGAGGVDDAFLARTGLIAAAIGRGVLDHLRAEGLLAGAGPTRSASAQRGTPHIAHDALVAPGARG